MVLVTIVAVLDPVIVNVVTDFVASPVPPARANQFCAVSLA